MRLTCFFLLVLANAWDAYNTGWGVTQRGLSAEANPIVWYAMAQLGVWPGLLAAKSTVLFAIAILFCVPKRVACLIALFGAALASLAACTWYL